MSGRASIFRYEVDGNGCWIWQGNFDANGYGRIYDAADRNLIWVHRYSYARHKGELLPGLEIDHTCQVTACVNPDHLDQVTRKEHVRRTMQRLGKDDLHRAAAHLRRIGLTYQEIADALEYSSKTAAHDAVKRAIAKGLVDPDEVPRLQRLTEVDREDIRLLYAFGVPQTAIGRFYEIDSSQVSRICSGKTSGHASKEEAA